ncbi:hypothetical protein N9140_00375, partial [bacterium]|nr:hypothetical protein [bacterium]
SMVGFLFLVIAAAASVSTSVTAFSVTSSSSFTIHGHLPRHNINNNCRRRHLNLALELYHHTHEDCETNNKLSSNNDDDVSSVSSISSNEHSRRSIIATTFTTLLTISSSSSTSCASASTDDEEKIYVKGVATLQSGITINNDTNNNPNNKNAALYVTARPNKADNVPRAILDGSNGRPPPVLSARYPNPTFPYEFRLTSQNYTPEGASSSSSIIEEGNNDDNNNNGVWWEDEDLVISARFDTDGIAATRDPTDLVGRGLYIKKKKMDDNENNVVSLELQGRGLFGKSVTAKK